MITIKFVYIMIFVILTVGLYNLFSIKKFQTVEDAYKKRKELLKKRERIIGRKLSKREKYKIKLDHLLKNVGIKKSTFICFIFTCGLLGVGIGYYIYSDIGLAILLGVLTVPIPYIVVTVRTHAYKQTIAQHLESTMSIITNTYVSNNDIIKSITDCVRQDKNNEKNILISEPFEDFVREVTLIDSNVERALRNLDAKINNTYFSNWIDILILSQSDKEYMFLLPSIIDDMNDSKRIQIEAKTSMYEIWFQYFVVTSTVLAIPLIIKYFSMPWYITLVHTLTGKILIIALFLSVVYSCSVALKVNKPINM